MKISLHEKYAIRDWLKSDAESLVKYANNRAVAINLRDGFAHPYRRENADVFLSHVEAQEPRTFFAIATSEEAIGGIGISLGRDVHRFTAELGYWLAEPFWNRGIVTAAVEQMTKWAFEKLELNRISATPYANNPASARVLEKAGFEREGKMRASVVKEGVVLDQLLYAKIKQASSNRRDSLEA